MTDDEKRKVKMELLLESQEAEEELALLCERAERQRLVHSAVEDVLGHVARGSFGDAFDVRLSVSTAKRATSEELLALCGEIRAVRVRMVDIKRRKEALGLK